MEGIKCQNLRNAIAYIVYSAEPNNPEKPQKHAPVLDQIIQNYLYLMYRTLTNQIDYCL